MMPEVFGTQALPVRDQYEAWRAWSRPLLDVMSPKAPNGGFCAENQVWKLDDGLLLSRFNVPASGTARSSRQIRRSPADHWVITHLLHGTTSIETSRGAIEVQARGSCVWSLGQVSSSKRSAIQRVDLLLSRDTFRDIAPLLDAATGSVLDAPLGRFLSDFLQTLLKQLPLFVANDAPHLTIAIGKLVAACVAPSSARVEAARMLIDVGRLEKIRQTVRAHLQSPLLGPQMLCRQVGMSRSSLYRLLDSEGGIASYIQRHRLMEARSRLSDIRNTQSIAAMARDLCFNDSSSFSRAFRAMFGLSPGDARAATAKRIMTVPMSPEARPTQACVNFSDLLRRH
jgi:AraC-like DNA-binding protein